MGIEVGGHAHSQLHSPGVGAPPRHKSQAPVSVARFDVTSSALAFEESGRVIMALLKAAGYLAAGRAVLKDNPAAARLVLKRPDVQALGRTVLEPAG